MYKYNIKITISNENSEEDNTKLKYEYESKDNAYDLMGDLKEEMYSKEPVSGDNTYNINIEVEEKDNDIESSDYAFGSLSMVSDSIYDIHTLIDSIMY